MTATQVTGGGFFIVACGCEYDVYGSPFSLALGSCLPSSCRDGSPPEQPADPSPLRCDALHGQGDLPPVDEIEVSVHFPLRVDGGTPLSTHERTEAGTRHGGRGQKRRSRWEYRGSEPRVRALLCTDTWNENAVAPVVNAPCLSPKVNRTVATTSWKTRDKKKRDAQVNTHKQASTHRTEQNRTEQRNRPRTETNSPLLLSVHTDPCSARFTIHAP